MRDLQALRASLLSVESSRCLCHQFVDGRPTGSYLETCFGEIAGADSSRISFFAKLFRAPPGVRRQYSDYTWPRCPAPFRERQELSVVGWLEAGRLFEDIQ